MTNQFTHLHVHSEYSIVNGIVKIPNLITKLKKIGQQSVAITDFGNLFASVKFYKATIRNGIKPIIGCEFLVKDEGIFSKLILLAQNNTGYKNLIQLSSKAYLQGQEKGQPIIHKNWLNQSSTLGLIALSGGVAGDIGQNIIKNNIARATMNAKHWMQLFSKSFYLELTRLGREDEELVNIESLKIAQKLQIPVVATNSVHFLEPDEFVAHEAKVCISQGFVLSDPRRKKQYSEQQYLKDSATMAEIFKDIPSAIENSNEIAKRCTVFLDFGKNYLPNFPIPQALTEAQYLTKLVNIGLEKRFKNSPLQPNSHYQQRLDIELGVINKMGFAGYFLIVSDFVHWAKERNIRVGPGRGSGAGSLVAYALNITNIDPLQYDLLFERFLNPERVSMPDFDIDFCMDKRDEVIEYVTDKYGKNQVAQIITYSNMNAKGVIRDVGRVLGFPYGLTDSIAKLIPNGLNISLTNELQQSPDLKARYQEESEVKDIIDLSLKLEGIKKNVGKHAAGVVIAPTDITDFSPIYCESLNSTTVTQFDKDDVEEIGLVKFDFLGLRTLTVFDWALDNINKLKPELNIDIDNINFEDPKVYQLFQSGNTTAVFQMESNGLQEMLRNLRPTEFNDIIAAVALYRPGPLNMEMDKTYIARKHRPNLVEYIHPRLKEILKPTFGVIVYQEQVMQIAQELAGYSLGEADILRRAMGKKKPEEMAQQRSIFESGASKNGVEPEIAKQVFDLMETFASYGFNKSHSVVYAFIAYQGAWLKTYYPAEYMAAVLSSEMDSTDKVVMLIKECTRMGIKVLPPDINTSEFKFIATNKKEIIYGLGAVKGLGEAVIEDIVENRKPDPYQSFFDFFQKIDTTKIKKRAIESLIQAGVFDSIALVESSPWQMRATFDKNSQRVISLAKKNQFDQISGQMSLFREDEDEQIKSARLIPAEPWSENKRLYHERDKLGMFITGHPINQYLPIIQNFTTHNLATLTENLNFACFAGLVTQRIIKNLKSGKKLLQLTVEDNNSTIEFSLFDRVFEQYNELITKDQVFVFSARTQTDRFRGGLRINVEYIYTLEQAQCHFAKYVELSYTSKNNPNINELKKILTSSNRGKSFIKINYQTQGTIATIWLDKSWNVSPSNNFVKRLQNITWLEKAEIRYK